MFKNSLLCSAFAIFLLCGTSPAQTSSEQAKSEPASEHQSAKPLAAYRLNFALSELDDGKKVNARQYALNLVPGYQPSNELKIGTRVPVEAKQGEMQYIDVGTSIWSRMMQQGDAVELEVHADLSNFAVTDQSTQATPSMPLLRQLRINASTVVALGKPMLVGVVDDPNSKRQYQLEVTVTQLR